MSTEITMPQLGESVTEGTITKWLVEPGDHVQKYDPIAEVMTDKVNAEVPSSYTGVIDELIAKVDETIAVGEVICKMSVEGAALEPRAEPKAETPSVSKTEQSTPEQDNSQKMRYSPAVLKLSQENNLDLQSIQGSGKGGRITRKDVLKAIEEGVSQQSVATSSVQQTEEQPSKSETTATSSNSGRQEIIPVTGVRKAIAQNMVNSKQTSPHAWMMIEVDVTNLVKAREQFKQTFKQNEGFNLTFLPFFMDAVIDGLKTYPQVNASWQGDHIIHYKDVHLSVAMATEEDLFVPVIRNADEKNIKGLARSLNDLGQKVKAGKLTTEDMKGGTFTLNNTGSFGSIQSQPIINQPQAAILSVESIVKRPVVVEGDAIAIRHMVNLCMSLDHRVMDGLIAGKFMQHVKERLEHIQSEQLSL